MPIISTQISKISLSQIFKYICTEFILKPKDHFTTSSLLTRFQQPQRDHFEEEILTSEQGVIFLSCNTFYFKMSLSKFLDIFIQLQHPAGDIGDPIKYYIYRYI